VIRNGSRGRRVRIDLIPRNLYAFALCLEIPPVDAGTSPIGAGQKPAVRQADHYVESVKRTFSTSDQPVMPALRCALPANR
jgi:hypothetical protein